MKFRGTRSMREIGEEALLGASGPSEFQSFTVWPLAGAVWAFADREPFHFQCHIVLRGRGGCRSLRIPVRNAGCRTKGGRTVSSCRTLAASTDGPETAKDPCIYYSQGWRGRCLPEAGGHRSAERPSKHR